MKLLELNFIELALVSIIRDDALACELGVSQTGPIGYLILENAQTFAGRIDHVVAEATLADIHSMLGRVVPDDIRDIA